MDETFRNKNKGGTVECGECKKLLTVGLLASHQAKQHGIYQLFVLEEDEEGAPSPRCWRWDAIISPVEGCYRRPVPDCPQGRKGNGVQDS